RVLRVLKPDAIGRVGDHKRRHLRRPEETDVSALKVDGKLSSTLGRPAGIDGFGIPISAYEGVGTDECAMGRKKGVKGVFGKVGMVEKAPRASKSAGRSARSNHGGFKEERS